MDVPDFYDLVWEKDDLRVYEYNSSLILFKQCYLIATMYGGRKTFASSYKNDFNRWVDAIKAKDIAKIEHTRELCQEALDTCNMIENLWKR